MRYLPASLSIVAFMICGPACGPSVSGGGGAGGGPDAGVTSGSGTSSTSGGDAGDSGASCAPTPIGRLCVRGDIDPQTGQEALTAGGAVHFQMYPKGCFSSSCTAVHEASCAVMSAAASAFDLTGTFCLEDTSKGAPGCTADCSGGGFAKCDQPGVAAGQYTATVDQLTVSFSVPSSLPAGGTCVGQQF